MAVFYINVLPEGCFEIGDECSNLSAAKPLTQNIEDNGEDDGSHLST
jgi:hypothetical protein